MCSCFSLSLSTANTCVEVTFFFFFELCLFFVSLFRHSARGAHETLVGGMDGVARKRGQKNGECENLNAHAKTISIQYLDSIGVIGAHVMLLYALV